MEIKKLLNFSILNLDKPSGPTSFSISDYVRKNLRKYNVNKTSHFGTLDPKVTGVLPIALGRACKLTGFFLGHDKTYIGILHTHTEQNIKDLQKIINKNFTGKIRQTPPIKSRVKRQERTREVKRFELIEQDDKDFLFIAEVEGGTYIRKLCSDLGELIGGAHMAELRRTQAGFFSEKDKEFHNLYDLDKAFEELEKNNPDEIKKLLIPAEVLIKKQFPIINVKKSAVKHLLTGKKLLKSQITNPEDFKKIKQEENFAIFHQDNFIEIAQKTTKKSNPEIIAKPMFVYN